MIVTACRVRANDESNSHLKRLAEFLSLVFSPTKSVTTFDVLLLCCAAQLTFRLLIPLSRCFLGVESEETKKPNHDKSLFQPSSNIQRKKILS